MVRHAADASPDEPETARRRTDTAVGETTVELVAALENLDTCEEEPDQPYECWEELYEFDDQFGNRIAELEKLESFPVFQRVDIKET